MNASLQKTAASLLLGAAFFLGVLPLPAADRFALIVGVDTYDHLPSQAQLQVAVSDAKRMAETLQSVAPAFDVTLLTDSGQDEAEEAIQAFLEKSKEAECVMLYFAGHGIEYFGTNYLIMRDTDISSVSADVNRMKRRLGNEALSLQELVDALDTTGAKVKLLVLDCCRDNPLEAEEPGGTRSLVGGRSGLAQMTPPSGTLISYSADLGQRANDGLFTAVLTEEIATSGLPILRVFASTRERVTEISTKWAEEDAAKGLPPDYRRVRHEPAEYNKLNLSGLDFTFTRGVPRDVQAADNAEVIALREQVKSLKKSIEELAALGVENEALREQLAKLEASVEAESGASTGTAPARMEEKESFSSLPVATRHNIPGWVWSPFFENQVVDVSDKRPGEVAVCPHSGRKFLIPEDFRIPPARKGISDR